MKSLLRYTAWNWNMGRVSAGVLLGFGAAVECVLLFAAAASINQAAMEYNGIMEASGTLWVAWLVYLMLPISAQWPQEAAGQKSRVSYTILTMPMPRWQILVARTLSTALWVAVGFAVQSLLLVLMYGPITALQSTVANGFFSFEVTAQGRFWWALADCGLFRLLLPANGAGSILVLLLILVPALMSAAACSHHGRRRVAAEVVALAVQMTLSALAYQLVVGYITGTRVLDMILKNRAATSVSLGLAGLVVMSVVWSVAALYRSEMTA